MFVSKLNVSSKLRFTYAAAGVPVGAAGSHGISVLSSRRRSAIAITIALRVMRAADNNNQKYKR